MPILETYYFMGKFVTEFDRQFVRLSNKLSGFYLWFWLRNIARRKSETSLCLECNQFAKYRGCEFIGWRIKRLTRLKITILSIRFFLHYFKIICKIHWDSTIFQIPCKSWDQYWVFSKLHWNLVIVHCLFAILENFLVSSSPKFSLINIHCQLSNFSLNGLIDFL